MKRFLRNIAIYAFHVGFARPVLLWFGGLRRRRRNRLPVGPCLVVSNHNSHLDAAILMSLFPLRRLPHVHPVAAADYFGKTWFMRMLALLFMNGIPISRTPPRGSDPLAPLTNALRTGETLVFFPEGSRGKAGVVAPFRTGIGRLVRKLPGLLIVPVFLSGPERIWARGHVVPVPLDIDAVVGKPRSYDSNLDPKEIAELVRRDVLALAPPAPPPPAPRPEPPVRIAVCGIDDPSRRELFRAIVDRLSALDRTLGISDPVLEGDPDGVREISGPSLLARGRRWLRLLPRLFRLGGRFKGERFVTMVERVQLDEAIGDGAAGRYVAINGSALVDLVAWAEADFYRGKFDENETGRLVQYLTGERTIPAGKWWTYLRKAPEVWMINVLGLARSPAPDVLVVATLPPARLMERIRSSGTRLEPYENEAFLTRLQEAYSNVGHTLARRRKMTLIEADLTKVSIDQVAEQVESICRDRSVDPVTDEVGT